MAVSAAVISVGARLLDDGQLARQVSVVADPAKLSAGQYDVAISFHVLEHVPDPPAMAAVVVSYLKRGGCALVADAFGVVDPAHPTHLASNLRYAYAGRTIELFEKRGMALQGMLPNWMYVFRKGARRHRLAHLGLKLKYRVGGYIATKRFARDYPDGTVDLEKLIRVPQSPFEYRESAALHAPSSVVTS